jgi:uncharacterized cupin superfamily protein
MPAILRFDPPSTAPETDHPREERREVGNPERRTWMLYEDAEAGMYAGIWESDAGRWRIQMDPNEHEYFIVLSGRCRLHGADGGYTEAGPGEAVVIPPAFTGSFEVLEAMRKHFVIVVKP